MDAFFNLLRLALDRGWAFGLLLSIFSGAIPIAGRLGAPLPQILREWSWAGLLFGLSVLVVSGVTHVWNALSNLDEDHSAQRAEKVAEIEEANEALANLCTLDRDELEVLRELLTHTPPRFEVHRASGAYALIGKGTLRVVRQLSGLSWICEVHPAILQHREEIVSRLRQLPFYA